MAKKDQNTEQPLAQNEPTVKETPKVKSLAGFGFKHILTPVDAGVNIFDFLTASKGAFEEDFAALFTRLISGLGLAVQGAVRNSRAFKNEAWELVYEIFYLGYLNPIYCKDMPVILHPLEKFKTFRDANNHSYHPFCGGCSSTPKSAVLWLLDLYVKSDFWANAEKNKRPIFSTIEEYQKFRVSV